MAKTTTTKNKKKTEGFFSSLLPGQSSLIYDAVSKQIESQKCQKDSFQRAFETVISNLLDKIFSIEKANKQYNAHKNDESNYDYVLYEFQKELSEKNKILAELFGEDDANPVVIRFVQNKDNKYDAKIVKANVKSTEKNCIDISINSAEAKKITVKCILEQIDSRANITAGKKTYNSFLPTIVLNNKTVQAAIENKLD